jgi:hypothetical protein
MSLLADLSAALGEDRRVALRRYGALLAEGVWRPDGAPALPEGAATELARLARFLDKCQAEVEQDVRAVQLAIEHRDKVLALPPDNNAQAAAAEAALKGYDADRAELVKARRAGYFQRYNAMIDAQTRGSEAQRAKEQLGRMKRANPDLLAAVEDPPVPGKG